ncbi:hypothetical protein L1987_25437 [Smallanthus sonchifolius]|uniref:Uncharacterized protein n=1 Tax=Smallanthus sonchifolius TaxID=185202 RepID=A0ACB9IPP8_9ASTR|nr:hypothetical protein L1987_25437 [Smallanthus sonchifolius]
MLGSAYYMAPEVIRKHYDNLCDVWSAGVIIYILLCGVPPFWDETEEGVYEQVLIGDLDLESEPWPRISESVKDLIKGMLVRDVSKRMTAHEVIAMSLSEEEIAGLKEMFKMMDIDGSNQITLEELKIGLEKADIDNDDGSGYITTEELHQACEKFGLGDVPLDEVMDEIDKDNDGKIDYSEFVDMMEESHFGKNIKPGC